MDFAISGLLAGVRIFQQSSEEQSKARSKGPDISELCWPLLQEEETEVAAKNQGLEEVLRSGREL